MTIYDLVTAGKVSSHWEENALEREPYYGEALFADRKQLGIEISSLQGSKPSVRPLNLSSFDAKVIPLERKAFEKITTEMPFFKNSYNFNEKNRQELNKVIAGGNEAFIKPVVDIYFNDADNLIANASVTREIMRMNIVTSGVIAFENNGQAVAYDYNITNKKTADWSDVAKANPVADIEALMDAVELKFGKRPSRVLMNSTTLNDFAKYSYIKTAILGEGKDKFISKKQVIAYLEEELDVTIVVYNKGYEDPETGNFIKFVPDHTISVFPDGYLGDGVFGTTPEESDLMGGATDAEVKVVDMGVAVTTTKETDPVNVATKVSEIYLPTLVSKDAIGILTITA